MASKLVQMKDVGTAESVYQGTDRLEWLDIDTGTVYADPEGQRVLRSMAPTEFLVNGKNEPIRHADGRPIHMSALSNEVAVSYYQNVANATGRSQKFYTRDEYGRQVLMDLAPADVHTAATLPNYAGGYKIAKGIADAASPVVGVPKQSNVYYTWNQAADFNRKLGSATSPGGAAFEVNPTLSPATYTTVQYALSGFLPTEVQSNADTPLQPFSKLMQVIVDGLLLEREYRTATLLQTSGNWNSNLVNTIASGSQWDGGGASDPVANLHKAIEQSYLPVTDIFWSELVEHDFLRNPAVQKYFTFKDMIDGLPDPGKLSSTLRLPPIHTAMMKYVTGGNLTYVWGNHVVLTHTPSTPPVNQMDVGTSYTFRWNGGPAPDGTVTAGFLVRSFFDPKRGARGGTTVVAVHNDTELMTSGLVGGLILNAHQ